MPKRRFNGKTLLALVAASILFSTFTLPAFANHTGYTKPKFTQITLYPFMQCANTLQCNARLFVGEEITFSGMLTDESGKGIPDLNVNIYHFMATELKVMVSAVTNEDGMFEVNWMSQLFEKKMIGETFKQGISETFTIYAQFEGDERYAPSRSGKQVFTVMTKDMLTFAQTDKKSYREDMAAFIVVNFVEGLVKEDGLTLFDFIEPDSIHATYDNIPVQLSKKKTGSYVFVTPPLKSGHHQLMIKAEKEGHNNRVGFVTVPVDRPSS